MRGPELSDLDREILECMGGQPVGTRVLAYDLEEAFRGDLMTQDRLGYTPRGGVSSYTAMRNALDKLYRWRLIERHYPRWGADEDLFSEGPFYGVSVENREQREHMRAMTRARGLLARRGLETETGVNASGKVYLQVIGGPAMDTLLGILERGAGG
jgi:hypothetical protein